MADSQSRYNSLNEVQFPKELRRGELTCPAQSAFAPQ